MTSCTIHRSTINGSLSLPPSKSQTHRALIFAALAHGTSHVKNVLPSPDIAALKSALEQFGARFDGNAIHGTGGKIGTPQREIDVGNSGISLRFLSALAAHSPHPVTITGDHSIRTQRPMKALIDALQVKIKCHEIEGYAPLTIQGPFEKTHTEVEGQDSQHVSALLISSLLAKQSTHISVSSPGELPWVDLTLHWFDRLGLKYEQKDYNHYTVYQVPIPSFEYVVPGDLSSAAFPIVAALITGSSITLKGVDLSEPQGDKRLIPILESMGATFEYKGTDLTIPPNQTLHGIEVDINDCIDTITSLAVVSCFAKGTTTIKGAAIARTKECDRITCIATELNKMGANITPTSDGLIIHSSPLTGAAVQSYEDHRMALALIAAGLGAKGITTVNRIDSIQKTYGSFIHDLQQLGAEIYGPV